MAVLARLPKPLLETLLFGITVALLVQPWRSVVGQDDASYAFFADSIRAGNWHPPDLLLAAAWPQALLGAAFGSVLAFMPPLSSYMLLTFIVFLANFFLFTSAVSKRKADFIGAIWISSFLVFPVTLQYGLAFLTETYVIFFLLLYFVFFKRWLEKPRAIDAFGLVLFATLIVLQRQTYLIFPLASALLLGSDRRGFQKSDWPVYLSVVIALLSYAVAPKTFLQAEMLKGMLERWQSYPSVAMTLIVFTSRMLQLLFAVGLFLTPLVFTFNWKTKSVATVALLNVVAFLLIYFAPGDPLTAGVLFTAYLPRIVGAAFVSFGIWGLSTILGDLLKLSRKPAFVVLICSIVFIAFTTFFDASDLKYVLPASLGLLFVRFLFLESEMNFDILKSHRWLFIAYCIVVGAVSVVANRYYLDTLDARFEVAKRLEKTGEKVELISAGYGRDSYRLGEACVQRARTKIASAELSVRESLMRTHVVQISPRQYEDEAVFRYLVKPFEIFGKKMKLNSNRLEGQSEAPIEIVRYSVFGLSNALAIYENKSPLMAWCFR